MLQSLHHSIARKPNLLFGGKISDAASATRYPTSSAAPQDTFQLRFGATSVSQTGFPPEDIAQIRTILQKYRYGVDLERLLNPASGFHATVQDGEVVLKDYYHPLKKRTLGVCNELACLAGLELAKTMKDRYQFAIVGGDCPTYFTRTHNLDPQGVTHYYLLGWKQSENDAMREALFDNETGLPPGCLVIDPSFGLVEPAESAGGYGRLTVPLNLKTKLKDYNRQKDQPFGKFPLAFQDAWFSRAFVPLGFLKDLDPAAPFRNAMTYLMFSKRETDQGIVYRPELALQPDPQGNISFATEFLNQISPHGPLSQLTAKLTADLDKAQSPKA